MASSQGGHMNDRNRYLAQLAAPGALSADTDPVETAEWRDALHSLAAQAGPQRARYILDTLAVTARELHPGWQPKHNTPNNNTNNNKQQSPFPGDPAIEERLA